MPIGVYDVRVVDYGYWRAVRRVASGPQKAAYSDGRILR